MRGIKFNLSRKELREKIRKCPLRLSYVDGRECRICGKNIDFRNEFYDGGFNYRAHKGCVEHGKAA